MGVISVVGLDKSNSAAAFVPNLTADCDLGREVAEVRRVTLFLGVVSSMFSSSVGVDGCWSEDDDDSTGISLLKLQFVGGE